MASGASATSPDLNETTNIELDIKDCQVQHVQVFVDRAEVTRVVPFTPSTCGMHNLVVKGLAPKADTNSIRVKAQPPTQGGGNAAPLDCTILEVSFDVNYRPFKPETEPGKEGDLAAKLAKATEEKMSITNELQRLQEQDGFVTSYMHSMLAGKSEPALAGAATRPPVGAPPVGTDLAAVKALLEFHSQTGADLDRKKLELSQQLVETGKVMDALNKELCQLRSYASSTKRTVASRDITIGLSVPEGAPGVGSGASVNLLLTYLVNSASWEPTYDIRASMEPSDKAAAGSPGTMNVTYYGVVKQSTGEDWENASVSLSTAAPAMAGTPPMPPTREARWKSSHRGPELGNARRGSAPHHRMLERRMVPQQAMMSNAFVPQQVWRLDLAGARRRMV